MHRLFSVQKGKNDVNHICKLHPRRAGAGAGDRSCGTAAAEGGEKTHMNFIKRIWNITINPTNQRISTVNESFLEKEEIFKNA